VLTGLYWGNLTERVHLEDPGVDEKITLKCYSRSGMGAFTGLIWLEIGTGGLIL